MRIVFKNLTTFEKFKSDAKRFAQLLKRLNTVQIHDPYYEWEVCENCVLLRDKYKGKNGKQRLIMTFY